MLAKEEYMKKHDRKYAQLHVTCKETGVKLDKELVPELVETSYEGKVTILWNQQVQTNRTAPYNKTDSTMRDNERGTRLLKTLQFEMGFLPRKKLKDFKT